MMVGELEKTLTKIEDKTLKVVVSLSPGVTIEVFEGIEFGHFQKDMAIFEPIEDSLKINAVRIDCKENKNEL